MNEQQIKDVIRRNTEPFYVGADLEISDQRLSKKGNVVCDYVYIVHHDPGPGIYGGYVCTYYLYGEIVLDKANCVVNHKTDEVLSEYEY